ncbi:MAG: hypothetical protein M3O74_13575 [Pseudomonadota bacterium]|nr:hypothetical protein [Pseudomonadota bacterium]
MANLDYEDDNPVPDDPRTMDCEVWARCRAAEMRKWEPTITVTFLRISPKLRNVPSIGKIWLPGPKHYSSNWLYHWAVLSNGVAYDEIYPGGVRLNEYKDFFLNGDALNFDEFPTLIQTV